MVKLECRYYSKMWRCWVEQTKDFSSHKDAEEYLGCILRRYGTVDWAKIDGKAVECV